jgi:hypothetical protein
MNDLANSAMIGIGATAATDAWALVRHRLFGIAPPNYGLVGRWMAQWPRGRFIHESMARIPAVKMERFIGWTAHYLTGVAFAGLLLLVAGSQWLLEPTLLPALLLGVASVAAPFLIMHPGMGAGIAASRLPRPGAARTHSLLNHVVFGLGLYGAARLVSWMTGLAG